jgi:hypothetical protein
VATIKEREVGARFFGYDLQGKVEREECCDRGVDVMNDGSQPRRRREWSAAIQSRDSNYNTGRLLVKHRIREYIHIDNGIFDVVPVDHLLDG